MLNSQRLWILEDDPGIRFVYEEVLGFRYDLRILTTLKDFEQALTEPEKPDLVIADLRLPDGTFLQFLGSEASEALVGIPFLIVSSLYDIDALRFSFDEGALDYIVKPFQKNELIVKVERALAAVPRRDEAPAPAPTPDLHDPFGLAALGLSRPLLPHLTLKEQAILALLLARENARGVSREQIVQAVWQGVKVHPKTLDVHLHNIRRKIRPTGLDVKATAPGMFALLRGQSNG